MRRWVIAALLLWFTPPDLCFGGAGAEPFNFLFLDANARAVGMGGAYTAIGGDANDLLYNPAGLAQVNSYEVTVMHNQHIDGVTQEYLAMAGPQGWGANLNYLNFGGIPKTTISQPNGTLGKFAFNDLAFGAGYGIKPIEDLGLGVGLKYILESIDDVSAQGYAADLGFLYSAAFARALRVALAIQNIGPQVKFTGVQERLPLNVRAGAAYGFEVFDQEGLVSLEGAKQLSEKVRFGFGAETVVAGIMPVRVGFNTRNDAGIGVTTGIGWRLKNLAVDYAFVPAGELGLTHRLSATFHWGGAAPQADLSVETREFILK